MKKVKILLIATLSVFAISCDNYFDINENPNDLHTDQALPNQYLPAAQLGCHRIQAGTMNRLGMIFSNAAGGNVKVYASPFNSEFSLNVGTTFYSGIFEGLYLNINTFQKIIDYKDDNGKYDAYKAISKISKAYYMQYIVDLYGNVPYTDAFKAAANLTPSYDDDQEIYLSLFEEIDEARTLLDNLDADDKIPSNDDIVFNGDINSWKAFANTIELKMLVRMSNVTGATATRRNDRLNSLAASSPTFITQDVVIQPGFSNSTNSQVNPMVSQFGWDAAGNITNRNLFCQSGHFVKCLNPYTSVNYASAAEQEIVPGSGINYPNVLDPRRSRIFSFAGTSPTSYQAGVTQGATDIDVKYPNSAPAQPSRLSPYFFNPHFQVTPLNGSGLPTTGTGNYYAVVDGYVMTAAEAFFIQAEAAHLGGAYSVLGLDAQTLFNNGVTATMSYYTATAGTYLATINTKPNFGYNPAFTFAQNHHAIMYQKWIALLNSNAIESYIDYTRTGFPITPMPLGTARTHKPYRLMYPQSEYIANSANVINLSMDDVFDSSNQYIPFWLQGDPALGN